MPDSLIATLASIVALLVLGGALGLLKRDQFSPAWLCLAAVLVLINDFALTSGYGMLPNLFQGSNWNWQGKVLAVGSSLAVASLPAFGWARCGLTLKQNPEGRRITYSVAALLCAVFAALALFSDNEPFVRETAAFQLTMPGFDEEPYYRGTLLLALNEALRVRSKLAGVTIGWAALLTAMMFGFGHALSFGKGAFAFDWMTMLVTGGPALLLVWFRERTGSLVLPIFLHNFANSIGLFI